MLSFASQLNAMVTVFFVADAQILCGSEGSEAVQLRLEVSGSGCN